MYSGRQLSVFRTECIKIPVFYATPMRFFSGLGSRLVSRWISNSVSYLKITSYIKLCVLRKDFRSNIGNDKCGFLHTDISRRVKGKRRKKINCIDIYSASYVIHGVDFILKDILINKYTIVCLHTHSAYGIVRVNILLTSWWHIY